MNKLWGLTKRVGCFVVAFPVIFALISCWLITTIAGGG
jgi:hypothetical protein